MAVNSGGLVESGLAVGVDVLTDGMVDPGVMIGVAVGVGDMVESGLGVGVDVIGGGMVGCGLAVGEVVGVVVGRGATVAVGLILIRLVLIAASSM